MKQRRKMRLAEQRLGTGITDRGRNVRREGSEVREMNEKWRKK
jgi:hypothetical protein